MDTADITPDYIVVGAGAAGCVLANRLSARHGQSVLLLEAGGPDQRMEMKIPAAFSKLFKSDADWNYTTESQPGCNGRRMYWPRGKALGGSSSINAMIYIRGHRRCFDAWAALGNPGWSFADLLPYFKKSERQERGADAFHGGDGAISVADPRDPNILSRRFVEAARAAGLPESVDFNGEAQEGAGLYQVTQKQGARHSAAAAYLMPAIRRPNLTIVTHAQVTRILFDEKQAVGVEYRRGGKTLNVRCTREVILCGGAVNSPQLLMLSGVGDGEHLQSLGIPVVCDLPGVGANLQDHLIAGLMWSCTQPVSLASAESVRNLARYLLRRKGPLSSNVAEAGGFARIDPTAPVPDLQLIFAPAYYREHGFRNPPGHGFSIGAILVQPYSRGTIRLNSPDPFVQPAIDPNYYGDERDISTMIDGCKLARRIGEGAALTEYRRDEVLPGSPFTSTDAWRQHLADSSETLYHPAGTCKMGSDPRAVVDAQLRVHGLNGLRVIDASIMPVVTNGNTQAPTVAIAEKGADLIQS